MSPQPKRGGGAYCFWCRSGRHLRWSLSALYLLHQWVDFDQTCTDTLLGEVIRFWWSWPHFQGNTSILKFSNFDKKSLSASLFLNQMTDSDQTSYIVTLRWFKDLIKFWWPCPNFQGHHTVKTVKFHILIKNTMSALLEPNDGFWPHFIYCNAVMV